MKKLIIIIICIVILLGLYLNAVEGQKGKNCRTATNECQEWFAQLGIESRMIYGSKWIDGVRYGHRWLEVDILFWTWEFESTSLRFKDVSSGYKIDWREKE